MKTHEKEPKNILERPVSRRQILSGAVASGVALSLGSSQVFAASPDKTIKIGYVSPLSGKLGAFGQCDPYILGLGRQELDKGLVINGTQYAVKLINVDSQSDPSRASQLAKELITKDKVNLMLSTSTPETTNPVADACEASGVPSLSTDVPWESFIYGRGAKPGDHSPFKWTYVFSFGVGSFGNCYLSMWDRMDTNKKVGVMYPNDADGNAVRNNLIPQLEKSGYKVIDPGAYEDGTTDYSSQIATFKRERCEIFNTFPIPHDFNRFWRQAAQQHYTNMVKVAQIAKTGLFPHQVEPLGQLGYNLATALFWSPIFPYDSLLTGVTGKELADGYQKTTGRQWNQQVGVSMSLLDVGVEALKQSSDPTSRDAVRKAISSLKCTTMLGDVDFNTGPLANVSVTPEIGAQWIKAPADSKYPLDLVTVEHVNDLNVPIQQALHPYNA